MLKPLYISPLGKGGVDIGIQNITRSMQRAGHQPSLRRLSHLFNFAPMAAKLALGRNWWQGHDLVQARSRCAWALRAPGLPLITTVHHIVTDPLLQPYSSPQQRLFYRLVEKTYDGLSVRLADEVICVSRYTQEQTRLTYGDRPTTVIYDGIDTEAFTPAPEFQRTNDLPEHTAPIRLLFVGNRTRRKGFDLLPKIMDQLGPQYVLYYTESFQGVQAAPPHPQMVRIGTPDRDGLIAAYRSCDVLLFPARVEGFGIVAAEAGACGKPVITTNASALPEVVNHGETGLLCELDNVQAFVQAIQELGEDPARRLQMGQAARERVASNFGYDVLARELEVVYRRALFGTA
ncbi:MAG: glycosyltransferase family 4 protein [Chloroflexi bacterium]|nr:glycosyltransferase family 4 protein [Chloroflexota bacterium]